MHFAFEERQLEFRAQLRAFTDKECGPDQVHAAWDSAGVIGPAWSASRWAALADMGVVGLTVPEEHGGLGLGLVDLVLLLEEAGRSGLPEPLLATTALAVPVLARTATLSGSSSAAPGPSGSSGAPELLARVAAGDAVVAVGVAGMPAVPDAVGADVLLLEHHEGEVACSTGPPSR